MLNVLYFASFREILGQAQEQLPADYQTVDCLLKDLAARGETWQQALLHNQNLQIAVNHDVANRQTAIKAGDEVAFFPPVTGG
ncbi:MULTISPECIES: molybdopterin converting factor subunit 1 [Thiomicrorhabdus]|uniref:Molybdopterin synthase sulfur carrier subunit n=1 Tax=Thiomicrorhabdus xiamenensis TaxID=2739063 RepID=A0A7D4NPW3_9GAMM|nr:MULTISPECIES: molybdopterin converting factor subunit 1 [Thiomicrorhabdus]MBO1924640.1 molybdopterin converting factor subunit 1 [Thiomicrorhabdus sp. 6S3-12]QKI88210.1 molybdopterin converting factor subunit 1 [Thiomicrorhabdus xiamenensis]